MSNVLSMKLPTLKNEIHSYFVISDLHSFHLDKNTLNILVQHAQKVSNPALIINGDLFDLAFMMKKNPNYQKWIKRSEGLEEFFLPKWGEEYDVVNEILDILEKHFVKIIFIGGNHDDLRIDEFKEAIPHEYRYHFSLEEKLRLKMRDITFIPYGVWLDIGDITIIHGLYHNVNCLKSHYDDCGKSLIIGHIHKARKQPFRHRDKTHHAWSLPCMSTLNPGYMRRKSNDWNLGYGLLHVIRNGTFRFNTFIIEDNYLILPSGELLVADKEEWDGKI